jgi:hypothetical protein
VTIKNNTDGSLIPNAAFSFTNNGGVTNYTTGANGSYVISNLVKGAKYQINTSIAGFKPSYNDVFGDFEYNPILIGLDEKLEEVKLIFKVVRPPPNTDCQIQAQIVLKFLNGTTALSGTTNGCFLSFDNKTIIRSNQKYTYVAT